MEKIEIAMPEKKSGAELRKIIEYYAEMREEEKSEFMKKLESLSSGSNLDKRDWINQLYLLLSPDGQQKAHLSIPKLVEDYLGLKIIHPALGDRPTGQFIGTRIQETNLKGMIEAARQKHSQGKDIDDVDRVLSNIYQEDRTESLLTKIEKIKRGFDFQGGSEVGQTLYVLQPNISVLERNFQLQEGVVVVR